MSMVCGLTTHGVLMSLSAANTRIMVGVAHFVLQKRMKRMAMHVYDTTREICVCYMIQQKHYLNAKVIARHKWKVYFGS